LLPPRLTTEQLSRADTAIESAAAERDRMSQELQKARESLTHVQAQSEALKAIQAQADAKDELRPWLARQGMESRPRIWEHIKVKEGWQTAVEAALADRIGAVEIGSLDSVSGFANDLPPARLTVFSSDAATSNSFGADSLAQQIQGEGAIASVVKQWVAQYRCADSVSAAVGSAKSASDGDAWITKDGHMASRGVIRFYAEEDLQAGRLARRSKIEQLETALRGQQLVVEESALALQRADASLAERKQELVSLRERAKTAQARAHELEMAELRLDEKIQRLTSQDSALNASLAALRAELTELQGQQATVGQSHDDAEQRFVAQQQEAERQKRAPESPRPGGRSGPRATAERGTRGARSAHGAAGCRGTAAKF